MIVIFLQKFHNSNRRDKKESMIHKKYFNMGIMEEWNQDEMNRTENQQYYKPIKEEYSLYHAIQAGIWSM